MDTSYKRLARRQLSDVLTTYSTVATPPCGWIAAIRDALDMTVRQFAARLGVAPSNVIRLEQRERDDTISLGALRRAADALDCNLVYAVVPRHPNTAAPGNNVLDTLIETRAREVATAEIHRVAHSMALEDQAVRTVDLETQIAERAATLAGTPRRLWDPEAIPTGYRSTKRRRAE